MPNNADIQCRVDRLLAGQRRARDLDAIFLWLRTRSFGHQTVKDIGDFVAHGDERDKGVAWVGVRSISKTLAFHIPRITKASRGELTPSDKQALQEAVIGSWHLARPEDVKAETGLEKNKVGKILKAAFKKIDSFDGRQVFTRDSLSETEERLLRKYSSTLSFNAIFSDKVLLDEFFICLRRNDLLSVNPINDVQGLTCFLAVFAIEKMHLSRIALEDGTVVRLRGGIAPEQGCTLVTYAAFETPNHWATRHLYSMVFETSCDSNRWCERDLLETSVGQWDFPLEINSKGKLSRLD